MAPVLCVRRFGAVVDALVRTVETLARVTIVTHFMAFLPKVVLGVMTERPQEPTEIEIVSGCSRLTFTRFGNGFEAHVDAIVKRFFASVGIAGMPDVVAVCCLF